jgi:hypothetical protein
LILLSERPASIRDMDEKEFWTIVDGTRASTAGRIEDQPNALAAVLSARPTEDVLGFLDAYRAVQLQGTTNDLAHAAALLLGGVGDDSFDDFLSWLICHGEQTYLRVLAEPDTVIDLAYDEHEADFGSAELFSYVADEVYVEQTGLEAPDDETEVPDNEGLYSDDRLRELFPRLWAHASANHRDYLEERRKRYERESASSGG